MSVEVSHKAYDYAKEEGLDRIAQMGAGPEFMNRFVAARSASIRPQLRQGRERAGIGVMNRMGEGTATGQYSTARAAVDAWGFGQFANAISESEAANENIRASAENNWMNILMDLDARKQAADQHNDAQEMNWLNTAVGVAGLIL